MRIFVAIATVGRPETVAAIVQNLERQDRKPDGIVVVGAAAADVEGLKARMPVVNVLLAEKGLCKQRNAAIRAVASVADVVIFFDDDFVPNAGYIAAVEDLFTGQGDVVGATGWLLADGAVGAGISFDAAVEMMTSYQKHDLPEERPAEALYGCNMALRVDALTGMEFDENLPLYGWLEDIDFTYRLSQRGRLVRTRDLTGVHMGIKSGRTSGRRLGYSQIANPIYLLKKRSAPPQLLGRLVVQNVISNIIRSVRPEPNIDRRGRLYGNFRAVVDMMLMKVDPNRAINF